MKPKAEPLAIRPRLRWSWHKSQTSAMKQGHHHTAYRN